MTVHISPEYAVKIFNDLPGHTRRQKADALSALIRLLREQRDAMPVKPRKAQPLAAIRNEVVGKAFGQIKAVRIDVDGVSVPLVALAIAYLSPAHSFHDVALREFEAANLKVIIEPTSRRPGRRIVDATPSAPERLSWVNPADNAIVSRILRIAGQGSNQKGSE